MIKKVLLSVMAFMVVFVALFFFNKVLVFKSPEVLMMDTFYKIPRNTVDVLCIGSSHAYTSCDTETYWNKYGIPVYCISGPSQPVASSYYYLLQALKKQTPSVVLLEASCMTDAVIDYEYGFVNNISWMPYNFIRMRALFSTVNKINLLHNVLYFKGRWKDLRADDFSFVFKNSRYDTHGFNPWWNYASTDDVITNFSTDFFIEPDDLSIKYTKKIVDLCHRKNIKLVVYVSPHNFNYDTYGKLNWYRVFFRDNGVDFIDGIQMVEELNIDPQIDNCNGHLSYFGAQKISDYIGNFLTEHQYIKNKKSDIEYAHWDECAQFYNKTASAYLLVNLLDDEEFFNDLVTLENVYVVAVGKVDKADECKNEFFYDFYHGIDNANFAYDNFFFKVFDKVGEISYSRNSGEKFFSFDVSDNNKIELVFSANNLYTVYNNTRAIVDKCDPKTNTVSFYVFNAINGELIIKRKMDF